ncbi:TIGR01777 family oxidoreductase [Microbacterium terricola]|uniref:Epimerase n=1 Tax=Microbacterium terricola TaxID=344163 RepID=A0ABM8DX91_9MICO|nr:TIGR01777 family oxidoreductase [Microbacterium terricola]UYK39048.1 TIGR01777 family oxidoreductase [Microbacterium terricola]BDV30244.1 epimerase [Microbacterium terricola]
MPDPSRVVIAGASGLIGTALVESLRNDGITVTRLVRRPAEAPDEVEWLADDAPLDPAVIEGATAVVGLNGATIGRFPWTSHYRHTLLWSRILPTRALARAVRSLGADAPAFVSASAVGYYGSDPGVRLTENAPRGGTFLADLCGEWETAARGAGDDARVALLRTAPVIHPKGVLAPLLLLTKAGLSGPIGRGTQVWPWISLDDQVRAIRHVIDRGLTGPVNVTGPTRATANDIGFELARQLGRPYLLRAPEWALRRVLGADAAESLLTSDADVVPTALDGSGFTFTHPTVDAAVAAALAS